MRAEPVRGLDRRRGALVLVLLVAGCVRLGVSIPRLGQPPDDPDNYLPLAESVARGEGFQFNGRPTAYRPPLYPLLVAPLTWLGAGRSLTPMLVALNVLLGVATVAFTAVAARRWGLGSTRVLVAAALVALDPVLVVQARSAMTETPAAFLQALALAALAGPGRFAAARGGVALGLAALCRPSTLAGSLLIGAAALLVPPGRSIERLVRAGAIGLGVIVLLAPWAIRNARLWGEPVWTTTHGGYTLYLANNPIYYREVLDGPPGAVWTGENQRRWFEEVNREAAGLPEQEADRSFARSARSFIAAHPGAFVRASLARLGRFWGVAPAGLVYPGPLRVLTALWTIPFWIAVALGLARPSVWRWPCVAAPALVLGLTLVHTVFWTDLRMRAPIVPALALLAAGAVVPGGAGGRRQAAGTPPAGTPPRPAFTPGPTTRTVERFSRGARIPVVVRNPAISGQPRPRLSPAGPTDHGRF